MKEEYSLKLLSLIWKCTKHLIKHGNSDILFVVATSEREKFYRKVEGVITTKTNDFVLV